MLPVMDNWDSLITTLSGTAPGALGEVADALGQSLSTVSGWKTRGIPAPHWAAVVALASDRGIPDVTLEALAELAARKLKEPMAEEARA